MARLLGAVAARGAPARPHHEHHRLRQAQRRRAVWGPQRSGAGAGAGAGRAALWRRPGQSPRPPRDGHSGLPASQRQPRPETPEDRVRAPSPGPGPPAAQRGGDRERRRLASGYQSARVSGLESPRRAGLRLLVFAHSRFKVVVSENNGDRFVRKPQRAMLEIEDTWSWPRNPPILGPQQSGLPQSLSEPRVQTLDWEPKIKDGAGRVGSGRAKLLGLSRSASPAGFRRFVKHGFTKPSRLAWPRPGNGKVRFALGALIARGRAGCQPGGEGLSLCGRFRLSRVRRWPSSSGCRLCTAALARPPPGGCRRAGLGKIASAAGSAALLVS